MEEPNFSDISSYDLIFQKAAPLFFASPSVTLKELVFQTYFGFRNRALLSLCLGLGYGCFFSPASQEWIFNILHCSWGTSLQQEQVAASSTWEILRKEQLHPPWCCYSSKYRRWKKSVWFPFLFNLAYEKRDIKQNLLEIIAAHSRICFWWTKYQLQRGQRGPTVTTEKEWDTCNALLTLSSSAWLMFYVNVSGFNLESSVPPHTCSLLSIRSQRGKTSLRSRHQHIQF